MLGTFRFEVDGKDWHGAGDPDGDCEDGDDAYCCRQDCPGGKGISCTKAQPGADVWWNVEDIVGQDMDGLKYTTITSKFITKRNTILLPNVSGTILTTGNLRELPPIFLNITDAILDVGGHTGFAGDIQMGGPAAAQESTVRLNAWIDGDLGLTFRTAAGCDSVVLTGSALYPTAMGVYDLYPNTYDRKPIWKHRNETWFMFFKSHEGMDSNGVDRGEGRWFVGEEIGAEEQRADANPMKLRMRHMSATPVDADLLMPGTSILPRAVAVQSFLS
jgi:hypothetical protein